MKLVILIKRFPPGYLAGAEIAAYNIAKNLAIDNNVHIITSKDKKLRKDNLDGNFCIHRLNYPDFSLFFSTLIFSLMAFCTLRSINPDVVHVQGIYSGFPAYLYKKFMNRPYVICFQGSGLYIPYRGITPLLRIIVRNAYKLIVLTEHMKITVKSKYKRDAVIIPNGIDLDRFTPMHVNKNTKSERTIVYIGSLIPIKGVNYLIEAMSSIINTYKHVKLFIVGSGYQEKYLKNISRLLNLEDHIIFTGTVSNDKIPYYLAHSDIFVLPSLSEGFPLSVLEAMAMGLPIITTRVRGLPSIVKDNENGLIVNPKNARQLSENIRLLLDNNDLIEKISTNNLEAARQYSWKVVIKKLEEMYSSIA